VPATGTFTVTVIDDIPVALANGVATVSGSAGRGTRCPLGIAAGDSAGDDGGRDGLGDGSVLPRARMRR